MRVSNWLTRLWNSLHAQGSLPGSCRASRRRASQTSRIERLEPRLLLTASPVGAEFQVNTTTEDSQVTNTTEQGGSVAMDADGDFVVVWQSTNQDGSGQGIYAQRYNAAGVAQGLEFQVNTTTLNSQSDAAVAMDADGDFVIVWRSANQDGSGEGIYAQRYNAAGVAQGLEFRVNTYTASNQRNPSVAMDAEGDFVVTWTSNSQDGSLYGIYAQRYTAAGVAQGAEFQVNTTTANQQANSTVAMDADGDFVVTWLSLYQDGDLWGIFAQRYNAAGVAQGTEFQVNTSTAGVQRSATVAMDADGDFVITWTSLSASQDGSNYGVYAQRFNAAGEMQGTEFQVNTTTANAQRSSTVAMDADGDFVVTWMSNHQDTSGYGVYAQSYNAAGQAQGLEFRVNTTTGGDQNFPSVAMSAEGDFVIAWSSSGQDGDSSGVFAQRYEESTDTAGPTVSGVLDATRPITEGERLVSVVPELTVTFSEDLNVTGGSSGVNSVTNPANWQLTRNGVDVSSTITGITFGFNAATNKYEAVLTVSTPLEDGQFELTARDTIQDLEGNALDGNVDGTPGSDFTIDFVVANVSAAGAEFRVNTTTAGQQTLNLQGQAGSVAMNAAGDFVVTWTSSGQDGSGTGIFAQRYNAAGVAQGGEFQVNSTTAGNQLNSTVAMDADGDFVITWSSPGQDGSSYGVYGQRYNAAGVAQGDEFQINTTTSSAQRFSTVAMDADGDFVVVWQSQGQDGSSYGIYGQRFDAAGAVQGTEFQINTTTVGSQDFPTVAMDANGNFVVTWNTYGQDGGGYGVYAQRYNAAGVAQGSEFLISTTTDGNQQFSNVAMDADGDFVITWSSYLQDGSIYGVYAQRYNAAGEALGGEFQVNTTPGGSQLFSTVAMDADGDFVITWTDSATDGSLYGVYARRFNAAGVAQGAEFRVNSTTLGSQRNPRAAMDANGDFVIVWASFGQDGDGYGVYGQRYESNLSPVLAEPDTITYTENDPASAIASGITVSDLDTATLASATITITNFVAGQDVLAFTNDGVTMGNIVVETNVGGVLTLTSAGATATLAEWQAALRGVTYENTSNTPDTTERSVEFVVNDGTDSSEVLTSTIEITATNDVPVLAEPGTITYIENDPATVIASGITVSDPDTATLASATITITNFVAGQDVLAFTNDGVTMGNIAVEINVGGVLTLTSAGATATLAEWQAALRGVTYENTSNTPDTTERSVEFVVNDGTDSSDVLTSTIEITATNDVPVLAEPGTITYIENDPATVIASDITVSDLDTATLASATITITNFVAGQDVLAFTNDGVTMGNIAVETNVGGVLTLTSAGATATLAEWQAALRGVTYENTSNTPDTTERSVEFVVNDGTDSSEVLTSTIEITATNDVPVLADLETEALTYVPGAEATSITATLTVTDLDHSEMSGAVIQISAGYQVGDVLAFVNTPNITGDFNAGTGTLTLTGTDSVANYQAALRSVTYSSSSSNAAPRTVSFEVHDGTDPGNTVSRIVGGYAQRIGGTVNVYGTQLVDAITITDSGPLQFVVNGTVTQFDSSQVTAINIFAYGGNDTVQIQSLTSGKSVTVYGGGGNDTLRVDSSVTAGVLLNGGDGNDLLIGGGGNDVLIGGPGNDWLNGGDGSDTLDGGAGNDVYAFGVATANQIDTVAEQANGGTDALNFAAMTTLVTVNLTSDATLATMAQRIVRVGSAGQSSHFENVFGGSANDVLTGNAANNELYGNGGNDTLSGGDGNDYLDGGEGNDLLKGGNQDDVLMGGVGNDSLLGEAGLDRLHGGEGANTLAGGLGDDVYVFTPAIANQLETVVELAGEGSDTLDFSALATAVTVNLTSDTALATMAKRIVKAGSVGQSAHFENAIGGSGNDQITGNAANNLLVGNLGNDTLSGGGGNDILLGGQGSDTLKGDSGRNLVIGGVGGDLLQGGTDGDLLLSGASAFESDPAILQALLAEWASGNSYTSRVNHLLGNTGGGENTTFTLDSSTVVNDANVDYLTGNSGQDWFLANSLQDVLTDKAVDETFTQIDTWI